MGWWLKDSTFFKTKVSPSPNINPIRKLNTNSNEKLTKMLRMNLDLTIWYFLRIFLSIFVDFHDSLKQNDDNCTIEHALAVYCRIQLGVTTLDYCWCTLMSGSAVIGSMEEITMEMSKISLEDKVPRKESLTSKRRRVNRVTVIMVDMIPKNTIVPMF